MQLATDAQAGAFESTGQNPLADIRELRSLLQALPHDPARAVSEIAGCLVAIREDAAFPAEALLEAVRLLDTAGRLPMRRFARYFLQAPHLSADSAQGDWRLAYGYYDDLAVLYERCLALLVFPESLPRRLGKQFAVFAIGAVQALAACYKWARFQYGPAPSELWPRLGRIVLQAERQGLAQQSASADEGQAGSIRTEYAALLALHAAALDGLQRGQVALAESLIAYVAADFVFSPQADSESLYWVDLAAGGPPLRLAQMPLALTPEMRFFRPGQAHARLSALLEQLEAGQPWPLDLALGQPATPMEIRTVLQHLLRNLAPMPVLRAFPRHRVHDRVDVVSGLAAVLALFSGASDALPAVPENWLLEDVSLGGFSARLQRQQGKGLRIGSLLALRPEGGENWLLGLVRRMNRCSEFDALVGIELLGHRLAVIDVPVVMADGQEAMQAALCCEHDGKAEEALLLLPVSVLSTGEAWTCQLAGQTCSLQTTVLPTVYADFQLVRCQMLPAA